MMRLKVFLAAIGSLSLLIMFLFVKNVSGTDEQSDRKIECDQLFDNGIYVYSWRVNVTGIGAAVTDYHYTIVVAGGESLIADTLAMIKTNAKDFFVKLLEKCSSLPDSSSITRQHILVLDGFVAQADSLHSSPVQLSHLLFGGQHQKSDDAFDGVINVYKFDYQHAGQVTIQSANDLIDADLHEHSKSLPNNFFRFPDGQFVICPTNSSHVANLAPDLKDGLPLAFIKDRNQTYCFEKGKGMAALYTDNFEGEKHVWPLLGSIQQIYALTPKIEFIHRQFVRIENGDLIVTFPK